MLELERRHLGREIGAIISKLKFKKKRQGNMSLACKNLALGELRQEDL